MYKTVANWSLDQSNPEQDVSYDQWTITESNKGFTLFKDLILFLA